MDSGDIIGLEITDVAHGGVFVARHEGRVVFVPDVIPGERARVRLTDVGKASFWRAEALEILDASPDRQAHVWGQADIDRPPENRPGGAEFGHIQLDRQRALKLHVLQDSLRRIGGLDLAATLSATMADAPSTGARIEESGDATGWRTRVSLHVDDEGRVGPYAARSHRVIEVNDLPLATAAVAEAARELPTRKPGRIDLVQPADGRVRVLARPDSVRRPRRGARPTKPDPALRETVIERAGGRDFRVDAGGFWQVHRLAADVLSQTVTGLLSLAGSAESLVDPEAQHLDLYGGVGLFAATLGDLGGPATRVISVESDSRATEHAGENLAAWVGARAETDRVDRFLARLNVGASSLERERLTRGVVVLDPPRAGAGREVVESLVALSPATVVYVACDPVALARDLATFHAAGYDAIQPVQGLDLFPHSHHVEAVVILQRSGIPAR